MAARVSGRYFTNGNTPEGIKAQVDDIRAKAAANHHSVKVGVNAFVIARDTEQEAQAVLAEIIGQGRPQAVALVMPPGRRARPRPKVRATGPSPASPTWCSTTTASKTNLIGTPRQIAERIVALKAVGVDLVATGFLHFQEEVEYFGQRV